MDVQEKPYNTNYFTKFTFLKCSEKKELYKAFDEFVHVKQNKRWFKRKKSQQLHENEGNTLNCLEVYFIEYQIFVICLLFFYFNLEVLALSQMCHNMLNQHWWTDL